MVQTVQTLWCDAAYLNPESGEGSIVAGVVRLLASSTVEFAGSTT